MDLLVDKQEANNLLADVNEFVQSINDDLAGAVLEVVGRFVIQLSKNGVGV